MPNKVPKLKPFKKTRTQSLLGTVHDIVSQPKSGI